MPEDTATIHALGHNGQLEVVVGGLAQNGRTGRGQRHIYSRSSLHTSSCGRYVSLFIVHGRERVGTYEM